LLAGGYKRGLLYSFKSMPIYLIQTLLSITYSLSQTVYAPLEYCLLMVLGEYVDHQKTGVVLIR